MRKGSSCWTCGATFYELTGSWDCPACVRQKKAEARAEKRQEERAVEEQRAADRAAAAAAAERLAESRREAVETVARIGEQIRAGHDKRVADAWAALDGEWSPPGVPAPPDEKECPACAERIKLRARKCRYCGEEFPDVDAQIAAAEAAWGASAGAAVRSLAADVVAKSSSTIEAAVRLFVATHPDLAEAKSKPHILFPLPEGRDLLLRRAAPLLAGVDTGRLEPGPALIAELGEALADTATLVVDLRTHGSATSRSYDVRLHFALREDGGGVTPVVPGLVAGWPPCLATDDLLLASSMGKDVTAAAPAAAHIQSGSGLSPGNNELTYLFLVPAGRLRLGWVPVVVEGNHPPQAVLARAKAVDLDLEPGQILRLQLDNPGEVRAVGRQGMWFGAGAGPDETPVHARRADVPWPAHVQRWLPLLTRVQIGRANRHSSSEGDPTELAGAYARLSALHAAGVPAEPERLEVPPLQDVAVSVMAGPQVLGPWIGGAAAAAPPAAVGAGFGGLFTGIQAGTVDPGTGAAAKAAAQQAVRRARAAVDAAVADAEPRAGSLLGERFAERDRLDAAVAEARARAEEAATVQAEWDAATAGIASKKTAADQATLPLKALAPRLGEALDAAVQAGGAGGVAAASELRTLHADVARMRSEHDALDGASGFFAKAKAAAQQVALLAQINIAEGKVKTTRNRAGLALLEAGEEACVPGAEAVVAEIAGARAAAADAVEAHAASEAARATRGAEWAGRLGIDALPEAGPAVARAQAKAALGDAQKARAAWPQDAAAALVAAEREAWPPPGHPVRVALDAWAAAKAAVPA